MDSVNLLALFAEVEADRAANPAVWAARAAKLDAAPGGKNYVAPAKCGKCGGTGHLPNFRHIAGGDCFDCDGAGKA